MAVHTVFGSSAPSYTVTVYDDGSPSITLGSYFYTYGDASVDWQCIGGRVYVPNNPNLIDKSITIMAYTSTATPVDLSQAPLRSATATVPVGGGWVDVSWDAVAAPVGTYIFIAYAFESSVGQYYMAVTQSDVGDDFVPSVDGVSVALGDATLLPDLDTQRSRYRMGSGGTSSTGSWYACDLIVDDGVPQAPLAAYGFNETSGTTAADSSGNGHDLTVNSASNFAPGHSGNALHQVGGGSANLITNATPWLETAERTMMFWGRRGSEGADTLSRSVYQLDSGGDEIFGIALSDGTDTVFTVRQSGTDVVLTAPEQPIGDWHHYALTYDQATVRAYIDGQLVGSQAAAGTIDTSDGNLYIYGDDYQQQVIDDLRLYDTALTQFQIKYQMNNLIVPPDVTPPSVPANLAATINLRNITLTWDASIDDVALQNYVVYRGTTADFTADGSSQIGGPADTTYTDIGRPEGTWYYRVAARDEAGNVSAASVAVKVDMPAVTAQDEYNFPSGFGWEVGDAYNDSGVGGVFGTKFGVTAATKLKGMRYYAPIAISGAVASIWKGQTRVWSKTGVGFATGWNEILFGDTIVAEPGITYVVSVWLPTGSVAYTARADSYQDTVRIELGSVYSIGAGGVFGEPAGDVRPGSESNSWFGVDVIVDNTSASLDSTFGATIPLENAKTGANGSDWAITGVGDTSNLGFAREFSVDTGETVEFSCHGDGTVIDIYRIGDYGALGWRQVATIANTATSQPDPEVIPDSNDGISCSNWSVTASWTVPADALSGLFIGVYRNATLDNASYIPFLVRNDSRQADIIVKLSEATWHLSYNYYGTPASPLTGKSAYGSGGPLGDIHSRTHAVSYHRPVVTREGIPQTYWLNDEAPFIRFLERSGFDVKYVASKDLDRDPATLDNGNILISSGHDEYWSEGMRDAAAAFRDSGRHVLFMSGNEVFWRTRFSEDYATMWVYKDTMDGPGTHIGGVPLDPVSWTGTWKDTRWTGRRPENTITGTDFRMNGVNDKTATFSATADYASHPFWRDSGLDGGDITVPGVIGFEADELKPTQPEGSYAVLANCVVNVDGSRADDNGQDYTGNGDLNWGVVSQRYSSGAVVVGFGTTQWSWGLDDVHDRGGAYTNAAMQQATLNLLTDLGAAPATTIAGLVTPTPVTSLDVYGAIPARSGKVKVWGGSDWSAHPLKEWDGTSWAVKKAKGYDGSKFIEGK